MCTACVYVSLVMCLYVYVYGDVTFSVYTSWGCFFVCKYMSSCIHIFADFFVFVLFNVYINSLQMFFYVYVS